MLRRSLRVPFVCNQVRVQSACCVNRNVTIPLTGLSSPVRPRRVQKIHDHLNEQQQHCRHYHYLAAFQPIGVWSSRINPAPSNDSACRSFSSTKDVSASKTTRPLGASPRQLADLEERVWSAVSSQVIDPATQKPLHQLGWLNRRLAISEKYDNENGKTSIQLLLRLPTLLHPSLAELKDMVRTAAETQVEQWADDQRLHPSEGPPTTIQVQVQALPALQPPEPWVVQAGRTTVEDVTQRLGPGLAHTTHIVAVYSCKGGVGKSTVAVNLAYELAARGGRVGLLDVDVYGPSLPTLLAGEEQSGSMDMAVRKSPLGSNMVCPIQHKGVKLLSLGYVSSKSGVPGSGRDEDASNAAAILRGPMAGRVVTQLLKGTDWGDLDVLVLDLPPGTGDVQLTVCQEVDVSCAVSVTTPSKLAVADAKKGVAMFEKLGIDTIAMVENMAFFECDNGTRHYPFGKGFAHTELLDTATTKMSSDNICQLPISEVANHANETGVPLCLSRPESAQIELAAFSKLADLVTRELFQLPFRRMSLENGMVLVEDDPFDLSTLKLGEDKGMLVVRFFSDAGATQKKIPPPSLRWRDPKTGQVLGDQGDEDSSATTAEPVVQKKGMMSIYKAPKSAKSNLAAERVEEKGRVGYEVTWNDGSRFIYSRTAIALAAGGTILES